MQNIEDIEAQVKLIKAQAKLLKKQSDTLNNTIKQAKKGLKKSIPEISDVQNTRLTKEELVIPRSIEQTEEVIYTTNKNIGVLYLISCRKKDKDVVKFGRTVNINSRIRQYTSSFSNVILHDMFYVRTNDIAEEKLLLDYIKYNNFIPYEGNEWFDIHIAIAQRLFKKFVEIRTTEISKKMIRPENEVCVFHINKSYFRQDPTNGTAKEITASDIIKEFLPECRLTDYIIALSHVYILVNMDTNKDIYDKLIDIVDGPCNMLLPDILFSMKNGMIREFTLGVSRRGYFRVPVYKYNNVLFTIYFDDLMKKYTSGADLDMRTYDNEEEYSKN